MCDKKDAEYLNLLKIDALGLTQLSAFERTLRMAGLPLDILFDLPLDDEKAYQIISEGKFSGIFQFNGAALQNIVKEAGCNNFEDIVAITTVARPGPLGSGATGEWIRRKRGKPVEYPHPVFEPFLKSTLGIMIYQEQIMTICREVGGMSWDDVTLVRKAMGKSMGEAEFNKYGGAFIAGAVQRGVSRETAEAVWRDMVSFGRYGFNRSHAVAYAMISYYCAWLKADYPLEFAAGTLTMSKDVEEQIKLLRELDKEGVDYVPVDENNRTEEWTIGNEDGRPILIGPLSNIKGLGPKTLNAILSGNVSDRLEKTLNRLLYSPGGPKTSIDSIYPVRDAIVRLVPDLHAANIVSTPVTMEELSTCSDRETVLVFGVIIRITPKDKNDPEAVAKRRGRKEYGPTKYINVRLKDDTGAVTCQIEPRDYERVGIPIEDRGNINSAIYVVKGEYLKNYNMIKVERIKYIGELNGEAESQQS